MTKEEMLKKYSPNYFENNYAVAQKKIMEAMLRGEKYVYLPGKNNPNEFKWVAIPETISKLREDGFDVDKVWEPYEYWSIEWDY